MAPTITRGLGGRKDVIILLVTLIVGLLALTWGLTMRQRLTGPKGVPTTELSSEQIVRLGTKARGPTRMVVFSPDAMARVVAYAPGQDPSSKVWRGVPAGTILKVTNLGIEGDDVWVHGLPQQMGDAEPVVVHGTFLENYTPLLLDKTIDLADVKLISLQSGENARRSISGWLRNVSSQTISQCVVTCVFQNRNEREVDVHRSDPLVLPPMELVRFHTHLTDKKFASIAVQITYATPDGLRNYLPQVVIQKSGL